MAYKDVHVTRNGPTINRARRAGRSVLVLFQALRYPVACSTCPNASRLPADLAAALAFALRYQGRKRVHKADEIMAEIVAGRLVDHLERAGFVVMKRPAGVGAAALGRGFEG